MKLRMLLAAGIGIVLAIAPSTASAKGPKSVEITGPGLNEPIRLNYDADAPVPLNALVETTGVYEVFATRTRWTAEAPDGRLGPRYVATYSLFGPDDKDQALRQHLYPFADDGPLVRTPAGQSMFGSTAPHDLWLRADDSLTGLFVAMGVPLPGNSRSANHDECGRGASLRAWPGRVRPGWSAPPR